MSLIERTGWLEKNRGIGIRPENQIFRSNTYAQPWHQAVCDWVGYMQLPYSYVVVLI